MSLVKLAPLKTHFMTDLLLGVVLIAAPFVLGDSDRGDATRFLVTLGALELMTAIDRLGSARRSKRQHGPRRSCPRVGDVTLRRR
jgi:hypothetical protein